MQAEEGFSTGSALLSALALALSAVIALSVVAIATALHAWRTGKNPPPTGGTWTPRPGGD